MSDAAACLCAFFQEKFLQIRKALPLYAPFFQSDKALLLPLFVSVGMLLLSKSHQSLHDYVCNTYCVSLEDVTIYLDKDEYRLSKETKKEGMGLEDPRYRPVSGVDHEEQ